MSEPGEVSVFYIGLGQYRPIGTLVHIPVKSGEKWPNSIPSKEKWDPILYFIEENRYISIYISQRKCQTYFYTSQQVYKCSFYKKKKHTV